MLTRAERAQVDALLGELTRAARPAFGRVEERIQEAIDRVTDALDRATEGRRLPAQLQIARAADRLPACGHGRPLMDWSGEQLVPPCGCRLVEPTDAVDETRGPVSTGTQVRRPVLRRPRSSSERVRGTPLARERRP